MLSHLKKRGKVSNAGTSADPQLDESVPDNQQQRKKKEMIQRKNEKLCTHTHAETRVTGRCVLFLKSNPMRLEAQRTVDGLDNRHKEPYICCDSKKMYLVTISLNQRSSDLSSFFLGGCTTAEHISVCRCMGTLCSVFLLHHVFKKIVSYTNYSTE